MAVNLTAIGGSKEDVARARQLGDQLVMEVGKVILGKSHEVKLAFTCLLGGGHLLIEDVPGVGKTLLAKSLATVLGLSFRRIQFTSDMLPADIVGMAVYDQREARFRFHPGPVFAHVVLADEINRATPKTQSALLEAMEEHQVTSDGETHPLPAPFFVIATQNPLNQIGTFPLPESQLDRFLLRIGLGYPAEALERKLLRGEDRRHLLDQIRTIVDTEELARLQQAARGVFLSEAVLDYVQALVRYTRQPGHFELGLSPRGAQDLVTAARCYALLSGHPGVHPEDVKAVFPAVAGHRLHPRAGTVAAGGDVARHVLESVPVG
jgi:MoxR-like ATPase